MRIGLLADTHDRLPAIAALVAEMAARRVELLLHAGDFCSPFAIAPLHELRVPIVGVFGRNDGDRDALTAAAATGLETELMEAPHSIEVDGHRLLLLHDLADARQQSLEEHEYVVHGCLHRPEMKHRGDTTIICPGEGCGWLHGSPGAAVLDLETKHVEFIKLGGPEWKT